MNDKELIGKVHSSLYRQCQTRGYAAPVDVLMDIGVLSKQNYENWRFGRVPYLEKVCTVNLKKLSFIMHQIRVYAGRSGLKPSFHQLKSPSIDPSNVEAKAPGKPELILDVVPLPSVLINLLRQAAIERFTL